MEKIIVTVTEHQWLDCSVSWFVKINGVKSGGECTSKGQAIQTAKELAKSLNAEFDEDINKTNELFS